MRVFLGIQVQDWKYPGSADDWLRGQIRDAFDYPVKDGARVGSVTFDDYVRFVAGSNDPAVTRDGHLGSQTAILQRDCIRYDILGRFESFQHDFGLILDRLNAAPEVYEADLS